MNSAVKRERFGLEVEREDAERLSADDMAARTTAQMQADALLAQQLRAAGGQLIVRGICLNCDTRCLSDAVYCDVECKADHEARVRAKVRPHGVGGAVE